MLTTTIMDMAIALGLGLLVGLQKERAASPLAGLRTFALITLIGAVAAVVADSTTDWVIVAGALAVAALMVAGNVVLAHGESGDDPGQTTEAAVVLMYFVGALVVVGPREVAIVLGGTIAMLLHLREELHTWVDRLSDRDVRAIMQFAVISLVILPVLPDRTYGPYDVINPRQVWWMVVLIVGLNLLGYAGFRLFSARAGTAMAGILGGVISSTATTISYSRQTKTEEGRDHVAVLIVWIASAVVWVRVMIEIGAVAPDFLPVAAPPLTIMLVVFCLLAALRWRSGTSPGESPLEPGNPSELKPAIFFGALYAFVLLLVAAAEDFLGDTGLYAAAALSGLTDVDAITLSTSRLVGTDRLDPETGWRLIVVAALSNMVFKLGIAAALGTRLYARRLAVMVAASMAAGGVLLYVWG